MICSSVMPRLSNGLAKTDKVIVHVCPCFPAFLVTLKVCLFSKMGDKPYTRVVEQDI